MKLLNIGCGASFHADWVNLDAAPVSPAVRAHDLAEPLPFADGHFAAVYASHVLEHFDPAGGLRLLRECLRVLEPGGVARIVVPDLEGIARAYLQALEGAAAGNREAQVRYDWMMLELYDQTVRTTSGGRMAAVLAQPLNEAQRHFIAGRVGEQAMGGSAGRESVLRRIAKEGAALLFGAKRAAALREGLFRARGEVHRWMYDRFSLERALRQAGFDDVRRRAADESAIAGFGRYGLDTVDGAARKPDSLYMEGRKP